MMHSTPAKQKPLIDLTKERPDPEWKRNIDLEIMRLNETLTLLMIGRTQ